MGLFPKIPDPPKYPEKILFCGWRRDIDDMIMVICSWIQKEKKNVIRLVMYLNMPTLLHNLSFTILPSKQYFLGKVRNVEIGIST